MNHTSSAPSEISRRQKSRGANHHLWNNNGTWWLHCTIHMADFTKWRLRKNLHTRDIEAARSRRDQILARQEIPTLNLQAA